MSFFKEIGKWVKGWRLDKLFSHDAAGQVTVIEAVKKTSEFLTKVHDFINSPQSSILAALLGDKYKDEVVRANVIIPEILATLQGIALLTDIPEALESYKFADDPKRDKIYHDIVTASISIFSDGKLSISDAAFALILLQDF